jgi:hypothetical protein
VAFLGDGEYTILGGLADARRLARQARVMEVADSGLLDPRGRAAGAALLEVDSRDGRGNDRSAGE